MLGVDSPKARLAIGGFSSQQRSVFDEKHGGGSRHPFEVPEQKKMAERSSRLFPPLFGASLIRPSVPDLRRPGREASGSSPYSPAVSFSPLDSDPRCSAARTFPPPTLVPLPACLL